MNILKYVAMNGWCTMLWQEGGSEDEYPFSTFSLGEILI